jgi:hypothetical protein
LEILVPGIFAGLVAIGVTLAIEKWGGRVGGLLGTLPSTIVPGALGIWAQSADPIEFQNGMSAVPLGMFVSAAFLWLWKVLPPKIPHWPSSSRLVAVVLVSLMSWLAGAAGLVVLLRHLASQPTASRMAGAGGLIALIGIGLWSTRNPGPSPSGTTKVSPLVLLARGLAAGAAISGAVYLSSKGDGLAAGIASVFPAIFLTTMVALWLSQEEAVYMGAVGPMMLGSSSVAAFALVSVFSFPWAGPFVGAGLAWIIAAFGTTLPAYLWLQRRGA